MNPFIPINPDYTIVGYREIFDDLETYKCLGYRHITEPDRPCGSPGRKEYTLTADLELVKGYQQKPVKVKASKKSPRRVVGTIEIISGPKTKKKMKKYTRTYHEVHYSDTGAEKGWYGPNQRFDDNPAGLAKAKASAKDYSKSHPFVRLVRVVAEKEVLEVFENKQVLTKAQIDEIKAKGSAAIQGLTGLVCSEGFLLSMDTMQHSPTRITISGYGPTVMFQISSRLV